MQAPVADIRTNGGTQPRDHLSTEVIDRYAEDLEAGATFPPIDVFHDGEACWLADGFHRIAAHKRLGITEIAIEIHEGTKRAAVLYSVGANAVHGYPRSNEDKRRAVLTLLKDEEWAAWSDGAIARACIVSDRFVSKVRKEISPNGSEIRTVERDGKTYNMNTANIGGNEPPKDSAVFDNTDAGEAMSSERPDDGPAPNMSQAGRIAWSLGELRKQTATLEPEEFLAATTYPRREIREHASELSMWLEHLIKEINVGKAA